MNKLLKVTQDADQSLSGAKSMCIPRCSSLGKQVRYLHEPLLMSLEFTVH